MAPGLSSAIFIIALTGLVSWATGFADSSGAVVGHLPAGLPHFQWPDLLDWDQFGALVMPVLVLSLVSFLETASSAQVEHQQAGTRWNENQDLVAQGLSKVSAGLFGSFATSASFSRSAVNLLAGAKTGYANVFSILLVVVVVQWFIPWLYHVPQAALAAIVVTAVLNLIKPMQILGLFRVSRVEACISVTTLALTILTAPRMYWGVFAGIALTQAYFIYQHLHPRIIEVGLHPDGSLRSRQLWQLPRWHPASWRCAWTPTWISPPLRRWSAMRPRPCSKTPAAAISPCSWSPSTVSTSQAWRPLPGSSAWWPSAAAPCMVGLKLPAEAPAARRPAAAAGLHHRALSHQQRISGPCLRQRARPANAIVHYLSQTQYRRWPLLHLFEIS